jgi:hypothetical protein
MRVVAEPENLAELISDCADLPEAVLAAGDAVAAGPDWRVPVAWHVDDVCFAQVDGLDDYGP